MRLESFSENEFVTRCCLFAERNKKKCGEQFILDINLLFKQLLV